VFSNPEVMSFFQRKKQIEHLEPKIRSTRIMHKNPEQKRVKLLQKENIEAKIPCA
jgi:hypothetical protein